MVEWRAISGYEGLYEVSNDGRIRRILSTSFCHRKLAESQVTEVRALLASGLSQQAIADKFGVTQTCIGKISRKLVFMPYAPRELRPALRKDRYLYLVLCKDGRTKNVVIHRLVAEAFLGPCPDGMQVNHIDGIRQNNVVANLEYVTPSGNQIHRYDTLRKSHKLTPDKAAEIRALLAQGLAPKSIAPRFGISIHMVKAIKYGKAWNRHQLPPR